MTILDTIIEHKIQEVNERRKSSSLDALKRAENFNRKTNSMSEALRKAPFGIIAEHKRRSPSKSVINDRLDLESVISGYTNNGASAISVLTDSTFFGGSDDDLIRARKMTSLPILRKEFIVDPYQIYESKVLGADAILLIAAALSTSELKEFASIARSLELEVLLEVHNLEELRRSLLPEVNMLGVNNRDLKTFRVSLNTSLDLAREIPESHVKVSESGISSPEAVRTLAEQGYHGFLIGEYFMKSDDPGTKLAAFINAL